MRRLPPLLLVWIVACGTTGTGVGGSTGTTTTQTTEKAMDEPTIGLTRATGDGNRVIEGRGSAAAPTRVEVSANPIAWIAITSDGTVAVDDTGATYRLDPLTPLEVSADPATLPQAAFRSTGSVATVSDGALVVDGSPIDGIDPLPDGRVVVDEQDRLLVLTGPTERYGHAVIGDAIEASGWALIDANNSVVTAFTIEAPDVIEGISPIWADTDGDGEREIVVTVSNADVGAAIVVFEEDGTRAASSAPIGRGGRWRHQLAVGAFGPGGETEIATMLTPHIGGVAQYFRHMGNELVKVAEKGTYTTHGIGSRNLDMTAAGDFDGDGRIELVVTTTDRMALIGLVRVDDGVEEAWRIDLDAALSSNLLPLATGTGIALIGGLRDGSVHRWFS